MSQALGETILVTVDSIESGEWVHAWLLYYFISLKVCNLKMDYFLDYFHLISPTFVSYNKISLFLNWLITYILLLVETPLSTESNLALWSQQSHQIFKNNLHRVCEHRFWNQTAYFWIFFLPLYSYENLSSTTVQLPLNVPTFKRKILKIILFCLLSRLSQLIHMKCFA